MGGQNQGPAALFTGLEKVKFKQLFVEQEIEPDTESGEAPLLPVIERSRPVGSTKEVQFRTSRPCFGTQKSHISHVVADAPNWEHSVAFRFERLEWVISFARNDHMDFVIPYEWQGQRLPYRPDFLVRLRRNDGTEMTVVVEVKGMEREQDRAKQVGTSRWVKAVNHHGGYGRWAYVVVRDPSKVEEELTKLR